MYSDEITITLPMGLLDPADPEKPRARLVRLRLPTISDEMVAQTKRAQLLASSLQQDKDFATAPMSTDVLFAAQLILSWEGVQLPDWRHVQRLSRPDWNALMDGIAKLEGDAVKAVAAADAAGQVRPL